MEYIFAAEVAEKITTADGLLLTVVGLVVVFVLLGVIIAFVELMHKLMANKGAEEEPKASPAPATGNQERIHSGVPAELPAAGKAGEDGAFIAAVSAVISASTGKPNGSFVIKSIKEG